jgi:hypothetical protein
MAGRKACMEAKCWQEKKLAWRLSDGRKSLHSSLTMAGNLLDGRKRGDFVNPGSEDRRRGRSAKQE